MTHAELTAELTRLARPDGGWGYAPDRHAHPEPTCLALLALGNAEVSAGVVRPALQWLETNRRPDGTYRFAAGRDEAAWTTALALFARLNTSATVEDTTPVARAILGIEGRPLIQSDDDINVNDIDGSLIGWPWATGTFSWVEPTAWATIALRKAGQGSHPRLAVARKLLLDRVLPDGGVNYGNRRILGLTLDPIPTSTALLLIALQETGDDERLTKSLEYLRAAALASDDVEHIAWAILALDVYRSPGTPSPTLDELQRRLSAALAARAATPYLRPATMPVALSALALGVEARNPFRLAAPAEAKALDGTKPASPSVPFGKRVKSFFQGLALNALTQLRPLAPQSGVHIATATGYNADLLDVLSRQFATFRERVPLKGKRVVLKPNLVEYHRDKVINTHPHFVSAVIELCRREQAAEVIVAEGPGHWRNVEYLVAASGLGDVLRHHKVPFVDLNHDEPVKSPNMGRLTKLDHLFLSHTVATAEVLISLPKLKTHHWAGATLSLKNLFGTVPGICYGWPKNELHWRGIDNSIVDIALTRTPDLAIVDGVIGMEGDGPLNGTPVATNVVVMGDDLVAVDATCCRLMQLDPKQVGYLVMGHGKKLGNIDEKAIVQVGDTIAERRKPFAVVPHFEKLRLA